MPGRQIAPGTSVGLFCQWGREQAMPANFQHSGCVNSTKEPPIRLPAVSESLDALACISFLATFGIGIVQCILVVSKPIRVNIC